MFMPIGNWDGQITECELLKMVDTCFFRLNKQVYLQFYYSYSVDSHVNTASKMHRLLTLHKCGKAIKLVESGKSSRKVAEEFQETLKYGKQCRP